MKFEGFVGQSYVANTVNLSCQRSVNLYPEMDETGLAKEKNTAALMRVPGMRLINGVGDGPVRASFVTSDGHAFVVSGNKLYEVTVLGSPVLRGTLNTSTGPVSIREQGFYLLITDGTNGYTYRYTLQVFATLAGDFPSGAKRVSHIDGYLIVDVPGTGQFQISGLNDVTWDALDVATAEGSPDYLISHVENNRELWLFNEKTTEVWFNSGDADFPFQRIPNAYFEMGCAAAFSVQVINGVVIWIGKNKYGQGQVFAAQGYNPQKISTTAIDIAIQSYGDISDATSWSYQMDGHNFYVLNFPSADSGNGKTWCYDLTAQAWHERAHFRNGAWSRDRVECHMFFDNQHIVGDYDTSAYYALDKDYHYFDVNGAIEIRWERTTPHISAGLKNVIHDALEIDMETGVGLEGDPLLQGHDPVVVLQFSDDDGRTWSSEIEARVGKLGETKTRVRFNRLGMSRKRVYRLYGTDPVKTKILGAEIMLRAGAS